MDYVLLVATPPSLVIGLLFPIHGGAGGYFIMTPLFIFTLFWFSRLKIAFILLLLLISSPFVLSEESLLSGRYLLSAQHLNIKDPTLVNRFNRFPSTDLEIEYIKKLRELPVWEETQEPIDFSPFRTDAEYIHKCRGFYLPQVVTGRHLEDGIPQGWRVGNCWFWPYGTLGLSDYPERLDISLEEYKAIPHKGMRLSLWNYANIEKFEIAKQWEMDQE
tara:strand:- start:4966 stop:5619 length:654 start_codon:yes stop_codon:yes gene_type:complete